MKTVKKVFSLHASKENSHKVCLLQGDPEQKTIVLEFSLNDAFVKHTFTSVHFVGAQKKFKRSIDLSSIADLNFSEPLLELSLGEENKVFFKSGGLSGTLLVSSSDIEKSIEKARPKEEWTYRYSFKIQTFLEAMEAHSYGKHTDSAAVDRPVRFISSEGRSIYISQDKIAACYLEKDEDIQNADILFYPNQMIQLLKTLDKTPGIFFYDEDDSNWSIVYGETRMWCPKLSIRPPRLEFLDVVEHLQKSKGYLVSILASEFLKHLTAIKPFFESSELKDKESAPFVQLVLLSEDLLQLQVTNRRALDVCKDVAVVYKGSLPVPNKEGFQLNYDFITEFVSSLIKNGSKESAIEIRWWPYAEEGYPTRGRAIAFSMGNNHYLVSRVSLKNNGRAAVL